VAEAKPTRLIPAIPTSARLSLGRTNSFVATHEQLQFQLDHARARDAVHDIADFSGLHAGLRERGLTGIMVASAVPSGANARELYLRRPDLGRRLSPESAQHLLELTSPTFKTVVVIADGLSALAVDRHALPLLDALFPHLTKPFAPVFIARNARVALGDEIGEILQAEMMILLIGERPGLSAPDSLGVYLTSNPRIGRTDAERNCISNVRHEGLNYADAAQRIAAYIQSAGLNGGTGYALKQPDPPEGDSPNVGQIG
jgi:ethanolamine ammonia-lyase small subunit